MRRHITHWLHVRMRSRLASWDNSGQSKKRLTMTMNWQSLLGERGSCRRSACRSRNKRLKDRVALSSYRTQTPSQNHPSRSCIAPRVRRPLSIAGDVPSRINCTIRLGIQSMPPRAFSHMSCLSGDHRVDPITHTHRNTTPLPHRWHLRLSLSLLLSTRRTNTQQ